MSKDFIFNAMRQLDLQNNQRQEICTILIAKLYSAVNSKP